VCDPDQLHVIHKFTYDGKFVMTLGTKGMKARDAGRLFDRPTDIAWVPDGRFFVTDGYGGTRVAKFDKDGKFLMDWGGPPKDPNNPGPNEFNTVSASPSATMGGSLLSIAVTRGSRCWMEHEDTSQWGEGLDPTSARRTEAQIFTAFCASRAASRGFTLSLMRCKYFLPSVSAAILLWLATVAGQTPKLVTVGQISRVDKQTRSFEMKSQAEVNNQPDVFSGGISIGTTIGKTAPAGKTDPNPPSLDNPARTFPGTTPRSLPTTTTDPGRQPEGTFRTMIFISDTTVCKDDAKAMLCDELKVNDRLRVTGDEKRGTRGAGIYATEIVRTHLK
jgi:hypothetical protein